VTREGALRAEFAAWLATGDHRAVLAAARRALADPATPSREREVALRALRCVEPDWVAGFVAGLGFLIIAAVVSFGLILRT
jgi:ferric-dicitrate binding protein FerR (iron transport regulator)